MKRVPSDLFRLALQGGVLLLGSPVHGEPGPFGTWAEDNEQEEPGEPDGDEMADGERACPTLM